MFCDPPASARSPESKPGHSLNLRERDKQRILGKEEPKKDSGRLCEYVGKEVGRVRLKVRPRRKVI